MDSKKKLEDEKNAKLKSEWWEEKKTLLLPELQDIGMCIVRNFREKKKGCSMTKTDLIDSVSRGHIGSFFKRSHKEIAYFLELFTEALPEYFDIKTYDEEIYFTRKDKDCKIDMVRYKLTRARLRARARSAWCDYFDRATSLNCENRSHVN